MELTDKRGIRVAFIDEESIDLPDFTNKSCMKELRYIDPYITIFRDLNSPFGPPVQRMLKSEFFINTDNKITDNKIPDTRH